MNGPRFTAAIKQLFYSRAHSFSVAFAFCDLRFFISGRGLSLAAHFHSLFNLGGLLFPFASAPIVFARPFHCAIYFWPTFILLLSLLLAKNKKKMAQEIIMALLLLRRRRPAAAKRRRIFIAAVIILFSFLFGLGRKKNKAPVKILAGDVYFMRHLFIFISARPN